MKIKGLEDRLVDVSATDTGVCSSAHASAVRTIKDNVAKVEAIADELMDRAEAAFSEREPKELPKNEGLKKLHLQESLFTEVVEETKETVTYDVVVVDNLDDEKVEEFEDEASARKYYETEVASKMNNGVWLRKWTLTPDLKNEECEEIDSWQKEELDEALSGSKYVEFLQNLTDSGKELATVIDKIIDETVTYAEARALISEITEALIAKRIEENPDNKIYDESLEEELVTEYKKPEDAEYRFQHKRPNLGMILMSALDGEGEVVYLYTPSDNSYTPSNLKLPEFPDKYEYSIDKDTNDIIIHGTDKDSLAPAVELIKFYGKTDDDYAYEKTNDGWDLYVFMYDEDWDETTGYTNPDHLPLPKGALTRADAKKLKVEAEDAIEDDIEEEDVVINESSWAENSYTWSKSRQPKIDAIFEAGLWEEFEDAVLEASDIVVGLHTDVYHIQNNAARTEPPYITDADIKEAKKLIFKLCDEYYEKAIAGDKVEEAAEPKTEAVEESIDSIDPIEETEELSLKGTMAKEAQPDPLEDGKAPIDHYEILDWLSEHEQAYKDAEMFFSAQNLILADVPVEDLIDWIFEHDQLWDDFRNRFGDPFMESVEKEPEAEVLEEAKIEEVRITTDGLRNFVPATPEAAIVWEKIVAADKIDTLEFMLEGTFPNGVGSKELNDILEEDNEWLLDMLNITNPVEQIEVTDTAIEA